MFKICVGFIFVSCFVLSYVLSQENSTKLPEDEDEDDFGEYDDKGSYCYRFTWLGPNYSNTTSIDDEENCKKIIEKNKLKNVPCKQPLVITFDGTHPNFTYLYENHRDQILCKKNKEVSCVKYSYSFNNQLRNITYMCAKVSALNEGSVTSGCWTEYDEDGLETEVCVCEPYGNLPCNSASLHFLGRMLVIFHIFILLYFKLSVSG